MITYTDDALAYIARLSEGGLRDAITLLDKTLSYSEEVTVENVVKALGTVDYDILFKLTDAIVDKKTAEVIKIIEEVYAEGKDLKQFIKSFMGFLLDIVKYDITREFMYMQMPVTYQATLQRRNDGWFQSCQRLLDVVVKLNSAIKWDTQPKVAIEAVLIGAIDG